MNLKALGIVVPLVAASCGVARALPTSASGGDSAMDRRAETDPGKSYALGLEYLVEGDGKGAEKAFRRALEADPKMARAMLGLAELAFQKKDLVGARRWIANARRVDPDNPHVLYSLGKLQYLEEKYKDAEHSFRQAIKVDPRMNRARIALGDLYLQVFGDPAAAVSAYREALEVEPGHAGAHYALGIALVRRGRIQEAEKELQRAAELDSKNPLALIALANLHLQNDPAQAAREYGRALERDPTNGNILFLRAQAHERAGQSERAEKDYLHLLELKPGAWAASLRLGMLLQAKGENERAKAAYLAVLKKNSKAAIAYNNLAWMAAETGSDLDRALAWARKARSLSPDQATVYDTLGWVYGARKEYPQAIASLKRALELAPNSPSIHYHLGLVYARSGMTEKAQEMFRKVIALEPNGALAEEARSHLGAH